MNSYDKQLRVKLKATVEKDVFGNDALPARVAPLLVDLVQ